VLQDVHRDERALEVEAPDQLRAAAHQPEPSAWDAWDGAHQDAADAPELRPALADAGAEKLAGPAPDGRARDERFRQALRFGRQAQPDAAAELCTQDAAQSAERSCAAQALATEQQPQVAQQNAVRLETAARQTPKPKARPAQAVRLPPEAVFQDAARRPWVQRVVQKQQE
jgi:hypothetical protein